MVVFILFVLINLLHLSKEAIELKQFETTRMSNLYCYLDTSIYRKYDYITFTIKYGSSFLKPNDLVLYSRFDNNLNFTKLSKASYSRCEQKSGSNIFLTIIIECYYNLRMDNNYKYLLLSFTSSNMQIVHFTHTNPAPCRAKFIKNPFLPQVVSGNDYIAINNNKNEYFLYISFSFENVNHTKINEYNIYYTLENKYDDRFFKKNSSYYRSTNQRLKNNRYTFYYKLPKKEDKNYICLKPGKETSEYDSITIIQLPRFPYELYKSKNISKSNNDYLYTNISNISIGNEVYYKIIIYSGNITIKFKFSNESFYDDYTGMTPISPKNKDIKGRDQIEYYTFKKEINSRFLLLETLGDQSPSFHIEQKEVDEYQQEKNRKRTIMILLICFGTVLFIIIILFIILYIRKKRLQRINYNIEKLVDNDAAIYAYPDASYDDQKVNSINE